MHPGARGVRYSWGRWTASCGRCPRPRAQNCSSATRRSSLTSCSCGRTSYVPCRLRLIADAAWSDGALRERTWLAASGSPETSFHERGARRALCGRRERPRPRLFRPAPKAPGQQRPLGQFHQAPRGDSAVGPANWCARGPFGVIPCSAGGKKPLMTPRRCRDANARRGHVPRGNRLGRFEQPEGPTRAAGEGLRDGTYPITVPICHASRLLSGASGRLTDTLRRLFVRLLACARGSSSARSTTPWENPGVSSRAWLAGTKQGRAV